jgi:hypothetical protein
VLLEGELDEAGGDVEDVRYIEMSFEMVERKPP